MRIKEFLINRYGPLAYETPVRPGNFTLLWGENEHGKTLTLDALIKMLLGRSVKGFGSIDRVEENPSGYTIIENDEGKEVKVPEDGDLEKITGLSASQCCNIFIVRNSELMIEKEGQFYTEVTDKLTGLRTTEIERLEETLRKLGKLTPTGSIRDTGNEKLKTRVESAQSTCEEIQILIEKVDQEKLENLEKDIVAKEDKIVVTENRLLLLDEARKRERYQTGQEALETLTTAMQGSALLETFGDDDFKVWQDAEKTVNEARTEINELSGKQKGNQEALQAKQQERQELERSLRIIEEQKQQINIEVKPALGEYEKGKDRMATHSFTRKFWNTTTVASSLLLAVSMIASAIGQTSILYGITGVLLAVAIVCWVYKFRLQTSGVGLVKLMMSINSRLARYGLNGDTFEDIISNIQKFEDDISKKYDEIQEIKKDEAVIAERIRNIVQEDLPREEKKIKESQEKIDNINVKCGVESLSDYQLKLRDKEGFNKSIDKSVSILGSHFNKTDGDLPEKIKRWQQEISELAQYESKTQGIKYDEEEATRLNERVSVLRAELEALKDAMEVFHRELEEIEKKASRILGIEAEEIVCSSTVDLQPTYEKLREFIDRIETNREDTLCILGILREIRDEEQEKVSELFGKDSTITEIYKDISDGLYEEVLFDQKKNVQVMRRDGKNIEAGQLSGGAYDQLYFAIRLALGNKILIGNPGFFIIDDPFIKADPVRLGKQIAMLKKICDTGWQILYFSAKGEVKETLVDDISNGIVNLIEIDNVHI